MVSGIVGIYSPSLPLFGTLSCPNFPLPLLQKIQVDSGYQAQSKRIHLKVVELLSNKYSMGDIHVTTYSPLIGAITMRGPRVIQKKILWIIRLLQFTKLTFTARNLQILRCLNKLRHLAPLLPLSKNHILTKGISQGLPGPSSPIPLVLTQEPVLFTPKQWI